MANFTDKQIADIADSQFIEAPHESELLKEIIPSLMTKVNALENAEPAEMTAEDISYENDAIAGVTEVAGALDAIVNTIRGDILTNYEITVQNTESTGSSTADSSLIGGRIISIVPVSGAESAVASASIDGTGVITITLVEAQAVGDAVFTVYCQKLVPVE
jgi:hypothetical protein